MSDDGRHPFQRRRNKKRTIQTPFQEALVAALERFGVNDGRKMSGRKLSLLLGRSANMASQLFNDGLVPAGETVLRIAEILELDKAGTDHLIRAAMETKAGQRSRDAFWIVQSTRLIAEIEAELVLLRVFLEELKLTKRFEQFVARRAKAAKKAAKRRAKKGKPPPPAEGAGPP